MIVSCPTYAIAAVVCIFFMAVIPYSLYALGMNSLDQISFGFTLGIWSAILMHFKLRDHVITHFNQVDDVQDGPNRFSAVFSITILTALYVSCASLLVIINKLTYPLDQKPVLDWAETYLL